MPASGLSSAMPKVKSRSSIGAQRNRTVPTLTRCRFDGLTIYRRRRDPEGTLRLEGGAKIDDRIAVGLRYSEQEATLVDDVEAVQRPKRRIASLVGLEAVEDVESLLAQPFAEPGHLAMKRALVRHNGKAVLVSGLAPLAMTSW